MKVKIKRLDKSLPLPKHETKGAVGFDFLATKDCEISPKQIFLIPTSNIIDVPKGFALMIVPRSSTPRKVGLSFPHSIGIIDQDYSGEEDEVMIQVYNFTNKLIKIKKGDKIAQGLFVKIEKVEWEEVDSHNKKTRGGFGSTDAKR